MKGQAMTIADKPMTFRAYMLKVAGYATAFPEQAARMRKDWKPAWRLYLKTFVPAKGEPCVR